MHHPSSSSVLMVLPSTIVSEIGTTSPSHSLLKSDITPPTARLGPCEAQHQCESAICGQRARKSFSSPCASCINTISYSRESLAKTVFFLAALIGSTWKRAAAFHDTTLQDGFFEGHGWAAGGGSRLPPFHVCTWSAVSFCKLLKNQLLVDAGFGCFWEVPFDSV